jgi:hypothetical protein
MGIRTSVTVAAIGIGLAIGCGGGGETGGETGGGTNSTGADGDDEGTSVADDGDGDDGATSNPPTGGDDDGPPGDDTADDTADDGPAPGGATFAELCALPGVILCDDFEDGWDPSWIEDGGDVRLVADAAVAGEGAQAIELATYDGQQSSKLIQQFDDVDEVYIRFDVRYDEAYDNTGGSHGPILGGSTSPPWGLLGTAGVAPAGDDHFVLNFEPLGPPVGEGGDLGFYAYFVNMQPDGNGDFWGNVFRSEMRPAPVVVPGQWHCAEYGLTLNTPGDNDDGVADFWFDGVHHGHFEGFQWRTIEGLRLNTFVLDSYNHFNDGPLPADAPNLVRYDNVVISTSPVGCLGG